MCWTHKHWRTKKPCGCSLRWELSYSTGLSPITEQVVTTRPSVWQACGIRELPPQWTAVGFLPSSVFVASIREPLLLPLCGISPPAEFKMLCIYKARVETLGETLGYLSRNKVYKTCGTRKPKKRQQSIWRRKGRHRYARGTRIPAPEWLRRRSSTKEDYLKAIVTRWYIYKYYGPQFP